MSTSPTRRAGPQPRPRPLNPCRPLWLAVLWLLATLPGRAAFAQTPPVTSGLRLHLAADLGVSTAAGNKVTAWNDQSGLGNHASQATTAAQPVLVAASNINGRPALRFDGGTDATVDRLDNTTASLSTNGSPNTVFMVARAVSGSDGGVPFTSRRTNPMLSYQLGFGSGAFYIYSDGVNAGSNATIPDQRTTIRAPFISTFRSTGPATTLGLRLNGTDQPVSQPAGMATETGAAGFVVGTRSDIPATAPWNGDYAELLVYNRALTPAEITQVEAYLSTKYAITIAANAPTISSFSPATGAAGTTVTITGTNLDQVTAVQIGGATATSVAVVGGSGNTQLTAVAGAGTQTGRVVLNYGGGTASSSTDFVVPQGNVTKLEYFLGTDPGFGNGTDVPVTAAPDISGVAFAVSLSSLSTGFYNLSVRSQDANGKWSLTSRRPFYYEPNASVAAPNVTKLEYFLDADPGFGSGVDVPVTAAPDISGVAVAVPLSSVSPGFHSLSIRSRDANGKWSLTSVRSFYYEPNASVAAPNVVKLEYFLDTDPGFGNGTDVPVTAAPDISGATLAVPLGSVSPGFHSLQLRARDANGKWSLTSVRTFYYEPVLAAAPNINKLEYYFDTDPGFGSATDVPVTPAADIAGFVFAADASGLADGAHRLFVRSRDANGKWSLVSNRAFVKNGCASSANFAAGLASSSYGIGGSAGGPAEAAFNTNPATPNTSNSPYLYNGGVIQADLGSAQTVSELRYKLTPSTTSSFTILVQTSATPTGTFTTIDTYVASLTAGTTTPVTRTLATPATARVFRLAVQNAAGQYVVLSGAGTYNFNCAGPSITSFTPSGGAGGTSVVITGTNFSGATALTFNGVPAPGFVVNSGTQITVSAPAGGSTGQLCVTTPGGTACSSTNYTYPPTIATGTVSPTAFCSSTFISVPFSTNTGAYNSGNQFKFQLSDASGAFTAGSRLYGSLSSQNGSGGVLTDTVAFRTAAGSGYRVRVVASSPATTGTDNGTNLTLYPTPVAAASSNSPVVYNGSIQLVATPTGQSGYNWYVNYTAGGGGYVGSGQTLTLPNAQPSQSGKYYVYVQNSNGCQDSASVRVLVQPNAVPVLSMAQFGYTGCAGAGFNIGFSVTGNSFAAGNVITAQLSDAAGSFASPTAIGSVSFTGQGGGSVTATIPTNTPTGAGYRIRLVGSSPAVTSTTDNGTNLSITTQPTATPSSNSPVAYGGTIQLNAATVAGATYFWTGPGFSSNQQNPTITNAASGNAGNYTLYVTVGGCQSPGVSVAVTVNPSPLPILSMAQFGGSACAGAQLTFGFSVTGNSFAPGNTVTAQLSDAAGSFASPVNVGAVAFSGQGNGSITATIPAGTPQGSGYRLRLTGDSPAVTSTTDNGTNLTINTLPAAVASSNSPVTFGGTIQLNAQTVAGATYFWTGPGFSSSQQNPTITNAASGNAGTYTLYVALGGCTSQATTSVSVGAAPAVVLATGPLSGSFCPGSGLSVPYSITSGSVNAGNVFSVQLSDAAGSFASAVTIGSVGSTAASGSIAAAIPTSTPAGSGYRVRVVASNPATIGSDNGTNLSVGPLTYTWTGAVSTDWFNGANWSCGQVPTATSTVLIPTGLGTYPVIGSGVGLALNLTVQTGASLQFLGTAGFNLYGNVVYNGNCYATRTSTWTFAGSGTQTVSGSTAVQFGNVVINPGATVLAANILCVYGNWTNNGSFLNGGSAYGVVFNGPTGFTQLIGGTSVTTFYNVTIDPNTVVNLGLNAVFAGNFVVNGGFGAAGYAVVFSGTVGQTIGGTGSSTYYNVTIDNTVGVTLVSNITVLGNWINNGLFVGGTYSVSFAGTVAQIIGGTQITNFYNVTFNNPVSVTLTQNIYVLGGFVNSGVFYGYQTVGGITTGCYVRFAGGAAQVITANATTYFYHFYVDNAAGVSLATNIYIAGNYYLYSGSFNPGTFTVYFNGFEGSTVVQTVGGYTGLSFYGWNIGSGAYVRLLQNVTWLGGFVNAGTFYGYNLVGGVYTGYTCVFGGSTAQLIGGGGVYEFWHVTWNNAVSVTLNQNISVWGNWLNNGGFVANGYLVSFIGNVAQLIGGAVNTVFHHITISNLVSVSLSQPVTVLGNWGGTGVFLGNGYLVYFNGTTAQTILTGLNTRFFDLRFNNASTVTLLSNLYLNGNWTNDGGFVANGFGVYFAGSALQLIAGAVLTQFHHLTIVSGAQVQLGRVVSILGDWTNNGSFLHGNFTVTFAGSIAQLIGGSTATIFYGITFANTGTVTLAQDIRVRGGWLNDGVFAAGNFIVYFDGSIAQLIGGSSVSRFYGLNILNTVGVSLSGPIFIAGNLVNDGLFTCANYLVTFNGTALQTIGGLSTTIFGDITTNNAVGVALGQHIRVRGDFRNLALFTAGGYIVYFDGSIAQGIYSTGTLTFHDVVFANLSGVTLQNNVFLTGSWTNNGGFAANGRLVTFSGSVLQLIGGTVATVFHHFTIATGASVRQDLGITLLGDFTNNGSFLHNNLLVLFNGTVLQTIAGTALTAFYDVTFNNPVNVSLGQHIDVLRNFLNLGGYCGCGFRTRFNGTVAQTIAGSGSTHFHDISFDNAAGITLLNGIFVSGLWVNNGGFLHGSQLVTFDGTGLQTIGGSALTAFWHWLNTNASPAGLSLLRDVTYLGNWTNNGRYCGCGFLSLFSGSTAQTLTCTTGNSNFHHLTLANTSAGGLTLVGNINVSGNWLQSGLWNPATYTVFFNGTAGQSIGVGGSSTLAQFYGLTIDNTSPAGLTLGCPLGLAGNFANNGVFACGLNTVFANGTTLQAFGGSAPTTFYSWTIQNPAGASCTGTGGTASTPALGLLHVLTLATGGGNLACDGRLTLISNATGTGMVVNQPGGGVCTGVATMERFITGLSGAAGYRHYSSPMQLSAGAISTTVQEFADDLPVFELNPAYNTVGNAASPFPTLFQYDETRLSASKPGFTDGWMVPTATDNLLPLRGYTAQTLPSTTVDIAGLLQNGPVSYSLTRGSLANSGWHLLGNPYPAPIDWDLVRGTSGALSGVADALYVFQPSGTYTGTYQSYVNGFGTNGGNKDLAAMQGFFVRATAPTATVSFGNAMRATSYLSPVFNRGTAGHQPALRLEARNVANGSTDETVVYFEAGAGLGFSAAHDAYKVQLNGAGRPSLWSLAGTEGLSINGLPDLATAPAIPLGVRVSQDGAHQLVLTDLANVPPGTQVWLEDRALNQRQNLAASPSYAFSMLASYSGQRFYLNFVAGSPLAVTTGQLAARTALYPNPTTATATLELTGLREQGAIAVEVLNVLGQPVQQHSVRARQGQLSTRLNLSALPTGVYTVRIHAQEGTVVKRLVKE